MQVSADFHSEMLLKKLSGLSHLEFMAAWSTVVNQHIQQCARRRIGGDFGDKIARLSILTDDRNPDKHVIYTGGTNGYIADHIHSGGVIKPRNRKYLAIPIDKSVKDKYPSELSDELFVIRRQEDGTRGRAYLAKQMKRKVKFLYVLKSQVYQKPRPWWPDDNEIRQVSQNFFNETFAE